MKTVIAITGGIGSGKTTATRIIAAASDVVTIELDEIAREIMNTDLELQAEIVKYLGPEAVVNERPNRDYIAKKIFGFGNMNVAYREYIDTLVHPKVWAKAKSLIEEYKKVEEFKVIVVESPFPIWGNISVDKIYYVYCDKITRIQRIMEREIIRPGGIIKLSCKEAYARIAAQPSDERYLREADDIIDNTGDGMKLRIQAKNIYSLLTTGMRQY